MTYCSLSSHERNESMAGSGFSVPGLLLIEQPGAWGKSGLADSGFDPAVARPVEKRAKAAGLKVLAIRRVGRANTGSERRWALRLPGEAGTRWGTFANDADLLELPLDGSWGELSAEPVWLVCLHSKRDQCCAVFGRPVATALEGIRPDQVWGCSHTGGHRFAPVVVALPGTVAGTVMYGRVAPDDAERVIEATETGHIVPDLLRGISGISPAAQVALGEAVSQSGLTGLAEWSVAAEERVTGSAYAIEVVNSRGGRALITVESRKVATPFPSCAKPGPDDQTQWTVTDFALTP